MTTTIDAPMARTLLPVSHFQPARSGRTARRSPTLSRSELRRLVLDMLG